MDLAGRWTQCKSELALRLEREDGEAWLDSLTLHHLDRDRVVLGGIPNSFFRSRILTRYREALLDVLATAFPEHAPDALAQLELRLASSPSANADVSLQAEDSAPAGGSEQLAFPGLPDPVSEAHPAPGAVGHNIPSPRGILASGLDPRLTLERFIVGAGMRPILEAIREVVRAPGHRFNPLLICAAAGQGKTHLLHGLGLALQQRDPKDGGAPRVLLGSAERFKQEVLDGMQTRRMKPVRERWGAADALLLDDLHFLLVAPRVQEELLLLFDEYISSGRAVAFTADRLPRALRGLNETLRTRLEAGLVVELNLPDVETRLRYLRQRAPEHGLILAEPEAQLLAERLRGTLRQMEGVLVRLAAYGGAGGRALTREFVEHVAAPALLEDGGPCDPVLAERIVGAVCERFAIAAKAMAGPSRSPTLVRARQVTVLLLKERAGLSYPEMGPWLGHRTPSTLSHALHTLQADLALNPHLQRLLHQVRGDLAREPATPPPRPAPRKPRISAARG